MTEQREKTSNGTARWIAAIVAVFVGTAVMATSVTFAITTAWLDNSKATLVEIKTSIVEAKMSIANVDAKLDRKLEKVEGDLNYHDKRLMRLEDRTKP